MVNLPGFQWVDNARSGGGTYATDGPSCILLHQTVSMGISPSYIAGHPFPPQFWANPYTGERWQTISPDRSAFALYQADYGISWTNKKGYTLQTEVVGVPVVNEATWTDEQCRWIGEQVVAPQAAWLASIGRPVDLNQVRYHTDSSGSASEYWSGRMGDGAEWDSFNGLCAHIDCPQNDHWDCSVERLDLIAAYARGATPEEEDLNDDQAQQLNEVHGLLKALTPTIQQSYNFDNEVHGLLKALTPTIQQTFNEANRVGRVADKNAAEGHDTNGLLHALTPTIQQTFNEAVRHGGIIDRLATGGTGEVDKAAVLRDASVDELLAELKRKMAPGPAANRDDNEGNS